MITIYDISGQKHNVKKQAWRHFDNMGINPTGASSFDARKKEKSRLPP